MPLLERLARWLPSAASSQPAPAVDVHLDDLVTSLMDDVFSQVPAKRQLQVLDFGVASSATVGFLGHFSCRVSFVDLLSYNAQIEVAESEQREQREDFVAFSHEQLVVYYQAMLDDFSVSSVDICLFWDLPNYLSAEHISALMKALAPRLHSNSCAHLIGIYNAHATVQSAQFGLRDLGLLTQRSAQIASTQRFHPYRQGELDNLLPSFKIDRSRLLGKGRVEYLLYHSERFQHQQESLRF